MSNSDNVSVNIIGGVTQMQHGSAATTQVAPQYDHEGLKGGMRSTPNGIESIEVTRSTAADLIPAGAGILSTARNAFSGGPARDLNAQSTRLIHQGMEITPSTALQLGLITKDASGNYVEATSRKAGVANAGQEENGDTPTVTDGSEPVAFTPETEGIVTEFASHFDGGAQDRVIAQALSGNTVIDAATAEAAGLSVEVANGQMSVARAAFEGQADRFVTSKGVDFANFTAWAHEAQPEAMQAAMRQHVYGRSPAAYGDLVEQYLQSVLPSAEALAQAGIPTKDSPKGTLVQLQGTWMALKTAAKLGLL